MNIRCIRIIGLMGIAILLAPAIPAQEKPELPKWEQRAVTFGSDEKANTKQLNDLAADGWEYVGPLAQNMVAFKRLRFGLVYSFEIPTTYIITGVAFSSDGKRIISASSDAGGTLHLLDAASGKLLRMIHHPYARSAAFMPDGKKAVSVGWDGDRTARVWDLEEGKEINRFEGGFTTGLTGVAISSDGKRVLFSSSGDKAARLLEIESGKQLQRFEGHTDLVHGSALSPDGKRSLTCGLDKTVRLWDNESGNELKRFEGHKDEVWVVAFSPDGKRAASCGKERAVLIWDLEAGKEIQRLEGHPGFVGAVAYSRDGRWIATGGYLGDGGICIWDAKTGKESYRLDGHKGSTHDLAFSPDGRFLASAGGDKTIKMWRLPKE